MAVVGGWVSDFGGILDGSDFGFGGSRSKRNAKRETITTGTKRSRVGVSKNPQLRPPIRSPKSIPVEAMCWYVWFGG